MTRSSRGFVMKNFFARAIATMCCGIATTMATVAQAKDAKEVPLSHQASPLAEEVAPGDAWWLAEAFAAEREDCETVVGSGGSMLPLYRDRTVLVLRRMDFGALERGMTVVFVGDSGRLVAHVLMEKTPRGWVARGMANPERDRTLVKARNYVGAVIKAYAPNPTVASVRTRVLPVANSGPTVAMRGFRPSPDALLALAPARVE